MLSQDPGRMIIRGAQATALGFAGRLGARLLFLFLAARLCGATAFGAYLLAVAAVELAVTIGALGTKKTIFRLLDGGGEDAARGPAHRLLDAALMVSAASIAIAGAIAGAALALPVAVLAPATATALLLLAPIVGGQALLDLGLAATRWKRAIRYEVVARSLIEPWALLAGMVCAWLLGWRVEALVAGYWCGTLCALAYAWWGVRRQFGPMRLFAYRPRRAALEAGLQGAGSNLGTDFLNALYGRADLYLVGILLGETGAGVYGMARQLVAPLRQVRQSFDALLIPLIARSLAARGAAGTAEALASSTRLILVLQLPLVLFLLFAGDPLLAWLGPGFAAGYQALLALAAAETIQTAFSVGDLVFVYLRPRVGFWLTLSSIALGLVVALLLIPSLGLTGAGLSVLGAYSVRAVLRSRILRRSFEVAIPRMNVAVPFAAAALASLAGAAAGSIATSGVGLAAAMLVYGAAIAIWAAASRHGLALSGFQTPPPADLGREIV